MRKGTQERNRARALGKKLCPPIFLGMVLVGLILNGCATPPAPKGEERVWPLPPETPRIRYLDTIGDEKISTLWGEAIMSWIDRLLGDSQGGGRKLRKPYGVAIDSQGRVYVADAGMAAVWVIDEGAKDKKAAVRLVGRSGGVRLNQPTGVAVAEDGRIYVSDVVLDKVFGFDPEGNLKVVIGKEGDFYNPAGLAIDQKGKRLYVADAGHHCIQVFDLEGKRLFVIGYRGKDSGLFNYPTNLFVRGGRLYVTDTMNFRVQILDLEGKFVHAFGEIGDGPGQFSRPKGIAVDGEGHIYVVDAAFDNFQIFDEKGRLMLSVGHAGYDRGEFTLPAGIFIDEEDRIYVVDSYNRRLQIFQYLGNRYKERMERETARKK